MRATLFLAVVLVGCADGADGPGDTDDRGVEPGSPLALALEAALGGIPDEETVLVWSTDDPLPAGTTIAPAYQEEGTDATITLAGERLFFFVDEEPHTLFEHDVSYVLVDPSTDDVEVTEAAWFPLVDGELFDAELVYGDPKDPGEPVFEEEAAFRFPIAPEDLPPAQVKDGKLNCADRKNGAVLVTGLLFPDTVRRDDIDTVADLVPWGQAGIDTFAEALRDRGYDVAVLDADAIKAETSSREAILDAIRTHAAKQAWDRFLVYYVGHGARDGRLIPHAPSGRGRLERITMTDLVTALAGHDIVDVDVAIDACFSGKGAQEVAAMTEEVKPLDLDLHLLAASQADEKARIVPRGALLGLSVAKWARRLPADTPVDLTAYPFRRLLTSSRPGAAGNSPTHGPAPSPIPLLEKRREGDRCLIAGDLDFQAYDRKVTLRGRRFGEDGGKVLLDNGCLDWVEAEVTYWSDRAITFHAPMASDGFPATLEEGAYLAEVDGGGLPCEGDPAAPPGAYRVRVERADGYANHGTGPKSPAIRAWAAPDRLQLRPQLYCMTGVQLPNAGFPNGLDHSEFYAPRTPASDWTDGATTVIATVRQAGDLFWDRADLLNFPPDNGDECTYLAPEWLLGTTWASRVEAPSFAAGGSWEPLVGGDWFTQKCHDAGIVPPGGSVAYWGFCMASDPPTETGRLGALIWYE